MARGPSKFQRRQSNDALLASLAADKDAEEKRLNEAARRQEEVQKAAADALNKIRTGEDEVHSLIPSLIHSVDPAATTKDLGKIFGKGHAQFQKHLSALTQSGLPFEDQLRALKTHQEKWQPLSAPIGEAMARTPQGLKIKEMYEDEQRRRSVEITLKQQQVERGATTAFKRDLEISASPTEIDASGNIRVRSTSEMLQGLSSHRDKAQAAYIAAQKDNDPVRARIAAVSLGTVGERLRRTQISQTREQSAAIAGLTDFMPTEVQPGMWTNPALATQRSAAERALQGAKQQLATLGPDALPEQQKTANELLKKMVDQLSRIDNTIKQGQQELEKAKIQSPFMSMITKRQEGEEDAAYAQRISERSAKWKGIAGGVFSAATTAAQVNAAYQQMTFDMPRRTIGAAAAVEGGLQSQVLDSFGFSAASRVKYGGDVLYGDRSLGLSGFAQANRLASQEMDRRRSAEASSMVNQGGQALLGLGIAAGGLVASMTGVGAPIGFGMMAAGVGMLGGAGMSVMGNTRLQETGLLGATTKGFADATRVGQFQQAQQDLLNSAMQRNRINVATQEALESGLATYGQNIRTAGAWAVDPGSLVEKARPYDETAIRKAGAAASYAYIKSKTRQSQYDGRYKDSQYYVNTDSVNMDTARSIRADAETQARDAQNQGNLQANVIANRNSYFAQLGMSAEEWSSRISGVAANMGAGYGRVGGAAQATQNLYGMGLAGVGSFEQLSGNAAALANITGRTDSTGDLKRILTDAVKSGFDNSRTGQMFVQSTTSLANAMGIRSTTGISQQLALGTRLIGGTEKDLEMMTRGMGGMANIMDTNRTMGGLNFAAFVAGGGLDLQGPLAQDAFDVSKSPQRALKVQADQRRIEAWKNKNARIGPDGKVLNESDLMYKMLDQQEFKDIDPAMRNALVQEGFGGIGKFSKAAMSGVNVTQAFAGQSSNISSLMDRIKSGKIKGPEARRELEKLVISGQAAFGNLNVDEATRRALSTTGLAETLGDSGQALLKQIGITDLGDFDKQKSIGEQKAKAAAVIQREQIAAKSALLAGDQGQRDRLGAADIRGLSRDGKIKFLKGGEEQEISLEQAQKVQAQGKGVKFTDTKEQAFADFLEKNSKASAAMQQQMLTTLEAVTSGKVQEVVVKNWEGMVMAQHQFFGTELKAPGK